MVKIMHVNAILYRTELDWTIQGSVLWVHSESFNSSVGLLAKASGFSSGFLPGSGSHSGTGLVSSSLSMDSVGFLFGLFTGLFTGTFTGTLTGTFTSTFSASFNLSASKLIFYTNYMAISMLVTVSAVSHIPYLLAWASGGNFQKMSPRS